MSKEPKDNFISRAVAGYKKTVPNPMVQALLAGGLVYGAGKLAWSPIVNTISALARHPAKAMGGMSDQDWDMAMWELKNKPMYKTWMPVAIGALAAGTSLVATSSGNRKNYGMFDWNAPTNLQGIFKAASDDLMYGGYVPEIDMSECISGIDAVSMFTNDPYLSNDPYVRKMGTAIVTDAANRAGSINPSLGNIFESAVNKI